MKYTSCPSFCAAVSMMALYDEKPAAVVLRNLGSFAQPTWEV